jgi:hypothetical protein
MAFQDAVVSRPVSVVTPVISSIAGAVRRYVMSVLPTEYIKDYFIDTELPMFRKMGRRRFRPLSRAQIEVRHLPLLSMKVEVTTDSSDFSSGTTFWTSTRFLRDPTELGRIIADDQNLVYVGYETERVVIRFQVSITVETDMKANELAMYLKRVLPVNQRFFLNDIDVATELPSEIVRAIWSATGMGDGSDPAVVESFRTYLRQVTGGNIEQVVNSASGRIAFAFAYRANPLMSITSAPAISVNRDGNVVRSAQVDLPFEADLSVPVAYAFRAEREAAPDAGVDSSATPPELVTDAGMPYFSAAVRTRPPTSLPGNLQMAFFTSLVTGDPDPMNALAPDVTDFSGVVGEQLRRYVYALLDLGQTDRVEAKLWLDGNDVDPNSWEFDPVDWTLTLSKPALQSRQKYHFALYVDMADIARLAPVARRPQAPSPMIRR